MGWKKKVDLLKKQTLQMADVPYEWVRSQLVSRFNRQLTKYQQFIESVYHIGKRSREALCGNGPSFKVRGGDQRPFGTRVHYQEHRWYCVRWYVFPHFSHSLYALLN